MGASLGFVELEPEVYVDAAEVELVAWSPRHDAPLVRLRSGAREPAPGFLQAGVSGRLHNAAQREASVLELVSSVLEARKVPPLDDHRPSPPPRPAPLTLGGRS